MSSSKQIFVLILVSILFASCSQDNIVFDDFVGDNGVVFETTDASNPTIAFGVVAIDDLMVNKGEIEASNNSEAVSILEFYDQQDMLVSLFSEDSEEIIDDLKTIDDSVWEHYQTNVTPDTYIMKIVASNAVDVVAVGKLIID